MRAENSLTLLFRLPGPTRHIFVQGIPDIAIDIEKSSEPIYVLFSTRQSSCCINCYYMAQAYVLPPDVNLHLFDVIAQYIVKIQRFDIYDLPVSCLFR